ncbi:MAG: phosphoenolpyruvate carboxykinase (ATP) [Bacteroidia bacterium]|nr:phosphoenolpyruvate carboxykinase (ATP) [Bacteroidia bacterium]MDW8157913.1 phosphoenolpyruvate carboxykinase (ATP) [Bacteroidia bacterium]
MNLNQLFSHLPIPLTNLQQIFYNLTAAELVEHTLRLGQGQLADNGALVVSTGEFTGRSPKDKYVVLDSQTESVVWWGDINHPYPSDKFEQLLARVSAYLQQKTVYVRDCLAGADPRYQIKIRVLNENPWQNLFVYNLFIRPTAEQLREFVPDFTILAVPGFRATPEIDGTRQHNFTIIDFSRKIILIGGSAYTGEIKKGIFTVLNYLLPLKGVLPMHCSANIGKDEQVAIFFGLSGTGKTTLSADPNRFLIGDDEHGWTDSGIFNFEGGCYAKCIDLSQEKEPQIWQAIKSGTLLENTTFYPGTRTVNFHDKSVTENTRAAYPIYYIPNAVEPSIAGTPKNIFFLTADAFGVLPPIARLTAGQAMYYFISGYTAKVAGTEAGVIEPQPTFSACFGQAFLPLPPTRYAQLLGAKLKQFNTRVWLVNTGWTGGPYGVGNRISLQYTRAIISAALEGKLENVSYYKDPIFGLAVPESVPNVPAEILKPKDTWLDPVAYDAQAAKLSQYFNQNFEKFAAFADAETKAAAPVWV